MNKLLKKGTRDGSVESLSQKGESVRRREATKEPVAVDEQRLKRRGKSHA